jgi:hypothetical protein
MFHRFSFWSLLNKKIGKREIRKNKKLQRFNEQKGHGLTREKSLHKLTVLLGFGKYSKSEQNIPLVPQFCGMVDAFR